MLSPLAARKARQAAGWRGLSVDLITNPQDHPLKKSDAGKENGRNLGEGFGREGDGDGDELDGKLDGYVVKLIWRTSKLEREKLRAIW